MTKHELLSLSGFPIVGEGKDQRAVGQFAGFPVEIFAPKDRRLLFRFSVAQRKGATRALQAMRRTLKGNAELAKHIIIDGDMQDIVVFLVFDKTNREPQELYRAAVAFLERIFSEHMTLPPDICPICNQSRGDALARHQGRLQFVHQNCLREAKDSKVQALELKQHNGGTLTGFFGGLLGGIVGAVPAFIGLHFFEFFIAILYAVIPLGIYYGWKLFKGKMNRVTTVFTIVYTAIMALALEIAVAHIYVYQGLVGSLYVPHWTLGDTLAIYFEPQFFVEYALPELALPMLFAALGIWIAWRRITVTDKGLLQSMETILAEAVSIQESDNRFDRG